jgi:hypothetical protein
MKIYAQHGHQPADKIVGGLEEKVVDGVIFSTRYADPQRMQERIADVRKARRDTDVLVDPEFYATRQIGTPNCQLKYLEDWDYFTAQRRRDLVRSDVVAGLLSKSFEVLDQLDVSAHIAPNIYISQSFDSMEAGIALNFIAASKPAFGGNKPVYATLAIDRRALLNTSDFKAFLNDLTALERPPDGYYVLIGGGLINERNDLAHSEVVDANIIGGWMLLNFILSQNGFRVLNGFADILTPFLGAVGGDVGATGWWSNLRVFSMGRYIKPEKPGGALPIPRYLSKLLLNRVKADELVAYSRVLPSVLNRLSHDDDYTAAIPTRKIEALQTWQALKSLNGEIVQSDLEASLNNLVQQVERAKGAYLQLQTRGLIGEGIETINEYLDQLSGAVGVFKKLAEL